jgi:hypothetical protein
MPVFECEYSVEFLHEKKAPRHFIAEELVISLSENIAVQELVPELPCWIVLKEQLTEIF